MMYKSWTTCILGLALACDPTPPAPSTGGLAGDVYLLMQNGDVKRGASNRVVAISAPDSLHRLIVQSCEEAESERQELLKLAAVAHTDWDNAPDSKDFSIANRAFERKLQAEARAKRFDPLARPIALLASLSGRIADTGIDGHYSLDSLPPGNFILWAETTIGDRHYLWLRIAEVLPGQSSKVDLDNGTVFNTRECSVAGVTH